MTSLKVRCGRCMLLLLLMMAFILPVQSCVKETPTTNPKPTHNLRLLTYYSYKDHQYIDQIRWDALTDAVFESVDVNPSSGALVHTWPISHLTDFTTKARSNDVKPWIAVVGTTWPNATFFPTINSHHKATFINNLVDFCRANRLYGVNLDIEPIPDVQLYSSFIAELATTLAKNGLKLSIAAEPYHLDLTPDAAKYLEWIHVMAYDMWYTKGYPEHSRYEDAVRAMEFYYESGIAKDKLVMGIPFYGRDNDTGFYRYRNIVGRYVTSPDTNSAKDSSVSGGIIWWNGPDLVTKKVEYVISQGYNGVGVYAAALDTFDERSLLSVIINHMIPKSA